MAVWIAFAGLLIAFGGLILTVMEGNKRVAYTQGHQAARVEALEAWRVNMRVDMHEISETLQEMRVGQTQVSADLRALTQLMIERTERRGTPRATGLIDD
jgi:hypothetical protein